MRNHLLIFVFAGVASMAMLAGCSRSTTPDASSQTATVSLKDGTTFQGTVTKTDASSITLQASTGETRTYPMTQVDSVKYVSVPPVSSSPVSSSTLPATAPVSTSNAPDSGPPPPSGEPYRTIPAGARVTVRNSDTIRADSAVRGETFPAVVTANVIGDDNRVAIPRGASATLIVRAAKGQGTLQGRSDLVLDLDSVTVDGRRYRLQTRDLVEQGKQGLGTNKRSAKFVGGGALLGTVIGAIAGGGKGAAIGAGAGAGAGLATQAVTRGKSVRIPAESILSFRLEAPVGIMPE